MKIKFLERDPRAGTVALMDSSRGQQLIDAGSAVQIDDRAEAAAAPAAESSGETAKPVVTPVKSQKSKAKD